MREPGDDGPTWRLRRLEESDVLELAALVRLDEYQALVSGVAAHEQVVRYEHAGMTWAGVVRPVRIAPGKTWLVVVVVPEDDFLAEVHRANLQSVALAVAFSLVAVLLSLAISRWIARSLQLLVAQTRRIRHLEFDETLVRSSPFREVGEVLEAFEGMKVGLRAFRKYLPVKLVRLLLERREEPVLDGETKQITLFFSDIEGFTTVSERLEPMEMARRLGAYLSTMSAHIQDRQGTVVQYVGDAIMAFWGAPLDVPEHAEQACRAALACQAAWREHFPELPTRIGLHTAEVAVGHFGSEERLYYGAVGDGVNLAARLEGINKLYGTRVILSEETQRLVSDEFETRHLDLVAVKGKARPCGIYELLGARDEAAPDRVARARAYDEAFTLYLERRWAEAAERFERLLAQGDDAAVSLLLERCRAYGTEPPPEGWDGVYVLRTK